MKRQRRRNRTLGDENTTYGQGGGFGGYRSFKPKPVEVGKEYDVTITETSRRGDGVAKVDGFVIFVANGKTGQKARIKITQVGNRFASGEIVESASSEQGATSTE
ncbi:MAG: TRAM domain-containing protein [Thaumarchaeota archaeon]|nr:TRAM domain-containing protein [Nitrososphaerota archaeon]